MNKIYLLLFKRGRNAYHAIHPWMVTNEQGQMRNFFFDRKKLVIAISSEAVFEDVFLWNEFRQKTKLSFIKIIWVATYRSYIMSAFRAKFYFGGIRVFLFFYKNTKDSGNSCLWLCISKTCFWWKNHNFFK